jgi:SAM-dependent methyltransferase
MIIDPVPPEELQNAIENPEPRELFKLDLGCGEVPMEGFKGVDKFAASGADYIHDLLDVPWPFEDESVDEARAIHLYEHFDGEERIRFMHELYRVLKPGAGCLIVCPAPWSNRAIQDPTHKWPPVCSESFFYFNAKWRADNKLNHYLGIHCDFDFNGSGIPSPYWGMRSEEVRQFAANSYVNGMTDMTFLVIKRARA